VLPQQSPTAIHRCEYNMPVELYQDYKDIFGFTVPYGVADGFLYNSVDTGGYSGVLLSNGRQFA
jgi:hypothetical protein